MTFTFRRTDNFFLFIRCASLSLLRQVLCSLIAGGQNGLPTFSKTPHLLFTVIVSFTPTCERPPGVWSRAIEFFWHGSQWLFLTVTGTMTRSSLYRRPFIQDCTRDTVSGESRFSVTDPCAHAQWNGRNVAGISSCSRRDNGQRWSMREGSSASGQNERRVRWTHRVLWSRPAFLKFF